MSRDTIIHYLDGWPLVVSRIFGKDHTDKALDEAYSTWTGFMRRGPHVLILDMRDGNAGSTAAQRAKVAEWIEKNEALLRAKRQIAHVLVFDNAIMRGIVTAVFWLRPPANPHYTAKNLDEAVDCAVARLREEGISVSAAQIAAAKNAGQRKSWAR